MVIWYAVPRKIWQPCLGPFIENYRNSPNFRATFYHSKICVLILATNWAGPQLGPFFNKLIRSHCSFPIESILEALSKNPQLRRQCDSGRLFSTRGNTLETGIDSKRTIS
jgi:hypothetical protein